MCRAGDDGRLCGFVVDRKSFTVMCGTSAKNGRSTQSRPPLASVFRGVFEFAKHRPCTPTAGQATQLEEPDWVDWASVRRGQAHWQRLLGPTFVALNAALLQGFTIARFADVLVLAGYTKSLTATWTRFRNTGWAIMDWLQHPLDDPHSNARQSIYRVRACVRACGVCACS